MSTDPEEENDASTPHTDSGAGTRVDVKMIVSEMEKPSTLVEPEICVQGEGGSREEVAPGREFENEEENMMEAVVEENITGEEEEGGNGDGGETEVVSGTSFGSPPIPLVHSVEEQAAVVSTPYVSPAVVLTDEKNVSLSRQGSDGASESQEESCMCETLPQEASITSDAVEPRSTSESSSEGQGKATESVSNEKGLLLGSEVATVEKGEASTSNPEEHVCGGDLNTAQEDLRSNSTEGAGCGVGDVSSEVSEQGQSEQTISEMKSESRTGCLEGEIAQNSECHSDAAQEDDCLSLSSAPPMPSDHVGNGEYCTATVEGESGNHRAGVSVSEGEHLAVSEQEEICQPTGMKEEEATTSKDDMVVDDGETSPVDVIIPKTSFLGSLSLPPRKANLAALKKKLKKKRKRLQHRESRPASLKMTPVVVDLAQNSGPKSGKPVRMHAKKQSSKKKLDTKSKRYRRDVTDGDLNPESSADSLTPTSKKHKNVRFSNFSPEDHPVTYGATNENILARPTLSTSEGS